MKDTKETVGMIYQRLIFPCIIIIYVYYNKFIVFHIA